MLDRRQLLLAVSAMAAACASRSPAPPSQPQRLSLATGAKGGGFLVYGEALSAVLAGTHLQLQVIETQGTAQNVNQLNAREADAALLVMGPAWDAWTGKAQWENKPVRSLRALFPMYETPFHLMAARASGINSLAQLAGKRVGVGPVRGTAEGFFRGLMEATGLSAQLVNASPSQHAQQLARGEIDAFWFGAGLPVPAFTEAAKLLPVQVFGLSDQECAAFLKRYPYFAAYQIPASTYSGQSVPVNSVAVWNFVAMHQDAPEDQAYWLTRLALETAPALTSRYPAAAATAAAHLSANTFLPFHPGALRYYRERGIKVPAV